MAAPNKTPQIDHPPKPTDMGYMNSPKTTVSGALEAMGVATEEVGVVTEGGAISREEGPFMQGWKKNANTLPFQQQ